MNGSGLLVALEALNSVRKQTEVSFARLSDQRRSHIYASGLPDEIIYTGSIVRVCGRGVISSRCVMGSVLTTIVLMLSSGSTAHQPWDEFADWFRSLKVPGIEKPLNPADALCCSPERDCQTTDYEADATGRYWINAEGERIQVPPDKILHRIDNPTGRAVACFRHFDGHPIVRCFVRPPES